MASLVFILLSLGSFSAQQIRPNGTKVLISAQNFCSDSAGIGSVSPLTHQQLEVIANLLSDAKSKFESKSDYAERLRGKADSICDKFMIFPISDSLTYDAETEKIFLVNPIEPDVVDEGGETRVYSFLATKRDSFSLFFDRAKMRKYPVFHVREIYGMLERNVNQNLFDTFELRKSAAARVYPSIRIGLIVKLSGTIPFNSESPLDEDVKRRTQYARIVRNSGWREDRTGIEDAYAISIGVEARGSVFYNAYTGKVIAATIKF